VAIAALNAHGAKANYRNALTIANNMPTGGLPALATVGANAGNGAASSTGISMGPGVGAPALGGAAAARLADKEKDALGEGPDVDGLREKKAADARAQERHDSRASNGRKGSEGSQSEGSGRKLKAPKSEARGEARTEKATHIPPRGEAFVEWFDSLSLSELDELLADESKGGLRGARAIIAENIRHPGALHEWLMVAEVRQFKKWGVSMRTIQEGRTLTEATIGRRFRHGAAGAGTMHNQLQAMVGSSQSFDEFLQKLNVWADHELFPVRSLRWPERAPLGRYGLPDNLQLKGL
jgi:hypothetical protein